MCTSSTNNSNNNDQLNNKASRSNSGKVTGNRRMSKKQTEHDELKHEEQDGFGLNKNKSLIINADVIVAKIRGTPLTNYEQIEVLGEGSYGKVIKVLHKETSLIRAMKIIKRNNRKSTQEEESIILNEIEMLKKMEHPNIIKIFEYYTDQIGYYLITEYCDKGELYDKLASKGCFTEIIAAKIFYQLLTAVNYCHLNNVIHRDLKPENIMISSMDKYGHYNIKVIDFGTAKIYESSKFENKVTGSSYYIAPEVLKGNYTSKCDLWSCGVILYVLLSGKPPFSGANDEQILESVKSAQYNLNIKQFEKISSDAKDLISKLLQLNIDKRLSAKDALKHSWFKKLNVVKNADQMDKKVVAETLERLKNPNEGNALQRLVIAYLIHNIPQLGGIKEANQIFNFFDEDSDGKISKEELSKGIKKLFNKELKEKEVTEEIFEACDRDMSNYIEYEEFIRMALDIRILLRKEILQFAFKYFDKDESGTITKDELYHIFKIDKDKDMKKSMDAIIKDIDKDASGDISFYEFQGMMIKIIDNGETEQENKNCD